MSGLVPVSRRRVGGAVGSEFGIRKISPKLLSNFVRLVLPQGRLTYNPFTSRQPAPQKPSIPDPTEIKPRKHAAQVNLVRAAD